jgi:hypothetical protein
VWLWVSCSCLFVLCVFGVVWSCVCVWVLCVCVRVRVVFGVFPALLFLAPFLMGSVLRNPFIWCHGGWSFGGVVRGGCVGAGGAGEQSL